MKLCRVGKLNKEKPALIDKDGNFRDLSNIIADLNPEYLNFETIEKISKLNTFISLDTRKSWIMEKGIKNKINLVNDISGFDYDENTIKVLKKYRIPFVIHH